MHRSHGKLALLVLALSAGSFAPPVPARAADDPNNQEVEADVITNWDAGCPADTRGRWDDMVRAWYDEMRNDAALPGGHGPAAYTIGTLNNDGYISDSHFVDPDLRAWGNDVDYADNGDALMIGFHGGNNNPDHRWIGYVKYDEPGTGNCYLYQGDIELGDGDLEFLHLSSCYSMDREDWWNEWNSTFNGLHQIDGFHGQMWIGRHFISDYRHFADDAFWISIADAWMDNMYMADVNDNFDQCPVARNVGTNADDSRDRLNTERYNFVLSDPPGLGQSRNHRARYIRGCDPRGKEALPQ